MGGSFLFQILLSIILANAKRIGQSESRHAASKLSKKDSIILGVVLGGFLFIVTVVVFLYRSYRQRKLRRQMGAIAAVAQIPPEQVAVHQNSNGVIQVGFDQMTPQQNFQPKFQNPNGFPQVKFETPGYAIHPSNQKFSQPENYSSDHANHQPSPYPLSSGTVEAVINNPSISSHPVLDQHIQGFNELNTNSNFLVNEAEIQKEYLPNQIS